MMHVKMHGQKKNPNFLNYRKIFFRERGKKKHHHHYYTRAHTHTHTHTSQRLCSSSSMMTSSLNTTTDGGYRLCEQLFQLALPSFYESQILGKHQYSSLSDFFSARASNLSTQRTIESSREPCFLLLADLAVYFNACSHLESNLVYLEWLFTLVRPLLYTILLIFILPLTIVLIAFGCSFFCFYMKHWSQLKSSISQSDWWEASAKSIAVFWEWHSYIFHAHEIVGIENIPAKGEGTLLSFLQVYVNCF
jgi:hypothetical protein